MNYVFSFIQTNNSCLFQNFDLRAIVVIENFKKSSIFIINIQHHQLQYFMNQIFKKTNVRPGLAFVNFLFLKFNKYLMSVRQFQIEIIVC